MLPRNRDVAHHRTLHNERRFIQRDNLAWNAITTHQGDKRGFFFHDHAGVSLKDDLADAGNGEFDWPRDIFSLPE